MWMEQAMFCLFSMLPHREPDCLPNSRLFPSRSILWFPASPKALCCHEKSAVQSRVRAVGAPQQFWKESTFSLLTAFCFPALCTFRTGIECCDLRGTWHHLIPLLWHHLGTNDDLSGHKDSSRVQPKGAHVCIYRSFAFGCVHSVLTGGIAGCCLHWKQNQELPGLIAVPPQSVVLATSGF